MIREDVSDPIANLIIDAEANTPTLIKLFADDNDIVVKNASPESSVKAVTDEKTETSDTGITDVQDGI